MTGQPHWEAAKRLFEHARALPPDAREAYLAGEASNAPAILDEVRSLLAWDDDATGFLDTPAARIADLSDWLTGASLVGHSLGSWRIVGIIGHGGMGTVYRAERADEAYTKQAAIKVIRAGLPSTGLVERFRRERETLATLDHPHIARIIDGGSTAAGHPYFVMELVEGVPVDRYCDEQRLTLEQRLDLFRSICDGVQYAHEHLVVHRDIKPDNILVGLDGRPKLLDFGVSKLLTHEAPIGDDAAAEATWMMTPDYASPEQVAGQSISTASDVYSLGVLLHVLLTGTRPYHLSGATPRAIEAQLSAASLTCPSLRAQMGADASDRAASRASTPARLARALRGDVDAIVARALARPLPERYSTVQQLVADLDAYRAAAPVAARGRAAGYLARTFIRRHAVGVSLAAVMAALALGGISAVLYQARAAADARGRAERRFNDVRRLARTFMFDVNDAIGNVPGTTAARALIVRNAIEYLDNLAREAEGDRSLQLELASAFVRVGDAQGNASGPNMGDISGAIASYGRAIAIADAARTSALSDVELSGTLGLAHRRLGDVLAVTGDLAGALRHAEASEALYREAAARDEATVEDRVQAGIGQIKLGDVLGNPNFPNLGRATDASARYDNALALFRQLDHTAPSNARVRRYLGLTLERLGTLHEHGRRWSDAAAAYRASFEIRQSLTKGEVVPAEARRDLAIAYEKLGNIARLTSQPDLASTHYRDALAQFQTLAEADPADVNAKRPVAIGQEKLAGVEATLRRAGAASTLLSRALETHRALAARDTANVQARCDVARVAEEIGDLRATPGTRASASSPCAGWRESLEARSALTTTRAGCATQPDIERLSTKLRSCR